MDSLLPTGEDARATRSTAVSPVWVTQDAGLHRRVTILNFARSGSRQADAPASAHFQSWDTYRGATRNEIQQSELQNA
ncbi:MAG: hypothetical protein KatS3mg109_1958 [Pirellulaceae bacterium]|nr:MAG: hypothetical protein KatS3mg109_1958 [Pirellulaceae bacterium]